MSGLRVKKNGSSGDVEFVNIENTQDLASALLAHDRDEEEDSLVGPKPELHAK